jgi:hypothetical protein
MLARPYHFTDAKGLDRLIRHDTITLPGTDEIFCTGKAGHPTGVLAYRAGAFVHELEVGSGFGARQSANALANYAIASARGKGLQSAVFLVRGDNEGMKRFAESLGAVKQSDPGDVLYLLSPA